MTLIDDAHRHLEAFCQRQPGVAIGADIFANLVTKAIDQSNSRSITFGTTSEFAGMKVAFKGAIDPTKMTVVLGKKPALLGDAPAPEVHLHDVGFDIHVFLGSTLMSEHRIDYGEITGGTVGNVDKFVIKGERSIGAWSPPTEHWRGMNNLPDGSVFTGDLKQEWEIQEKAVQLIAKDLLGPALLESIELPNVIRMLPGISFIGPVRIGGETDLIMFSGPAEWKIGCPRGRAALLPPVSNVAKNVNGLLEEGGVGGTMDDDDPNAVYSMEPENIDKIMSADVFVHLPEEFVNHRFDGVTKPAAGFNDDGHIGPIYWHYESAIIVQTLLISLVSVWPLEFKIEVPSKGVGVAGAGVKIGCVYWEAAGAAFNGEIDPLEILFRINLDTKRSELYFESRFGNVKAHDFQFHHWPAKLDFPLDEVADFVLARVVEILINGKVGELLNVTRFSLVDFSLVRGFGPMKPVMAAKSSPGAATVGVSFRR